MKRLICEMCTSNDMVKQEGLFVCQSCGTKYSPEEAKKMMVDVTGSTVKIDFAEEVDNYYKLARRARDEKNYKDALRYYEGILIKQPDNWEASFFVAYASAMECTVEEIIKACELICANVKTTLSLIKEHLHTREEQAEAVHMIARYCISLVPVLYSKVENFELANWNVAAGGATPEMQTQNQNIAKQLNFKLINAVTEKKIGIMNMIYYVGDIIEYEFAGYVELHIAFLSAWKNGVALAPKLVLQEPAVENSYYAYIKKIQRYEGRFGQNFTPLPKARACYVATCVYGSYDCPQVWTLRRYRDETLASTWYGKVFIRVYYATSPIFVRLFGNMSWFEVFWKNVLDRMVYKLNEQGVEDTPYCDE